MTELSTKLLEDRVEGLEKESAKQKDEQERMEIAINILYGMGFAAFSGKEILRLELARDAGVQLVNQGSSIFAVGGSILAFLAAGLAIAKIYQRYKRTGKLL